MNTFIEKQKFTQWWLWLLLAVMGCFYAFTVYQTYEDSPIFSNLGFLFFLLFILLFGMMQLTTTVNQKSIEIKFFPFVNKTIKWEDVKSAEVLNYGFVGGWGIRLWTKYGTVYNTSGNIGLAIILKNDKKVCVGTQKENELKQILEEVKKEYDLENVNLK